MNHETAVRLVKMILMLIIAGVGVVLVVKHSNVWLALGIALLLWANNIERSIFKQDE